MRVCGFEPGPSGMVIHLAWPGPALAGLDGSEYGVCLNIGSREAILYGSLLPPPFAPGRLGQGRILAGLNQAVVPLHNGQVGCLPQSHGLSFFLRPTKHDVCSKHTEREGEVSIN